MARRRGFEALMQIVGESWCLGQSYSGDGKPVQVTDFIPATGTVTADQFVEWVFLASPPDAFDGSPKWERARVAIRAAFVRHMGGEAVDAGALRWTIVEGRAPPMIPLGHPGLFARNLTDAELEAYREIHGAESREWILAQRELSRRRHPLWKALILLAVWLTGAVVLARQFGWL
jgi:hypothetical protein